MCLLNASFELSGGLFEDGQLREGPPDGSHPIPTIFSLFSILHLAAYSNNKNIKTQDNFQNIFLRND